MNKYRRTLYSIIMYLLPSGVKRANFIKSKKLFGAIGENVMLQPRSLPYNPELCFLGDNVRVASGVEFITHDVVHRVLNNLPEFKENGAVFKEKFGEIHIGNNVFIGANTIVMYGVNVGSNVIIGAGSIIVKDIPDNSVCAGVPCRRIGSFDDFVKNVN